MNVFKKDDIEIRYKVEGAQGPVYVLLHGFGGGPHDWASVVPELAKNYRVVIPNLKTFFSHATPISFSQQVTVLVAFVESLYGRKSVATLNLMGQSYGATLSLGLRLEAACQIDQHVLLNAMPFRPFENVRNRSIEILLNMVSMPGGVKMVMKSSVGRQGLEELARVFRIGALSAHEIHHFNDRKMRLVEMAFDRFRWIVRNEDWSVWDKKLATLVEGAITRFVFSSGDTLFSRDDYRAWAERFKAGEVIEVAHDGHLLAQDMGPRVLY